jgi:hypothetical protein
MSDLPATRFDRLVNRTKDHPIVAVALFLGLSLGAILGLVSGLISIVSAYRKPGPDLTLEQATLIQDPREITVFRKRWLDSGLFPSSAEQIILEPSENQLRPLSQSSTTGSNSFPLIDILLRNRGDAPSYLHALALDIKLSESSLRLPLWNCSPFAPSWSYSAAIDPLRKRQRIFSELGHKVPAADLERFVVVLGEDRHMPVPPFTLKASVRHDLNATTEIGVFHVRSYHNPCGNSFRQGPVLLPEMTHGFHTLAPNSAAPADQKAPLPGR